jgi:DNA-binding phage protein
LLRDIRILKARGLSMAAIAQQLGMSRATLYRVLEEAKR